MKKQRTLRLDITIALLVIILIVLIGASFYHFHDHLGWTDAFYLTVMTVMTVGYGDFHPTNQASKIFTTIFGIISVPALVFCLGLIIEDVFFSKVKKLESEVERMLSKEEKIIEEEKEIIKKEEEILKVSKK